MNDCPAEKESSCVENSDDGVSSNVASESSSDNSPRTPDYSTVFTFTESEVEHDEHDTSFASFLETNLIDELPTQEYSTYKVVIDNLDLFIRPRSETSEHHAESKHFVNVYAVKDRIPCHILNNTLHTLNLAEVNVEDVLPKVCDIEEMKENLTTIATRIVR